MCCLWWTVWPRDAVRKSNPQKMTLACHRVLSSSEVRASESRIRRVVGSNPIWGSDFFCVLLWLILYISLYFLYNINISGVDMQQSNEKDFHGQKLSLNRYFIFVIIIFQRNDGDCETSLSLKCQSLHSFNLLPSIWSIKGIRSSTQRTSIRIDRFVSEPTSN